MYSNWQAAWLSACVTGVALLAYAAVQLWASSSLVAAHMGSIVIATVLGVGVCTLLVASSFRLGLHLSASQGSSLQMVVLTAAIYIVVLAIITLMPIRTHAVLIDMPRDQEESSFFRVMALPIGIVILVLFAIPSVVSYCVARASRSRAGVA